MSRRAVIPVFFALVLPALPFSGCASQEKFENHLSTGQLYYKWKKWADATHHLGLAVNEKPSHYEARLLLGNASMEYGNDLFVQADKLARQGVRKADDQANKGNLWHEVSRAQFLKAIDLDSSRMDGYYGLGRLHYFRIASPLMYPYGPARQEDEKERLRVEEQLEKRRREEIGGGIDAFRKVLERVPDSRYTHRYLGILLFYRGMLNLDQPDKEEQIREDLSSGREHLLVFKEQVDKAVDVAMKKPFPSPEASRIVRDKIGDMQEELEPITRVLRVYDVAVTDEEKKLLKKPGLSPADQRRLAWLAKERKVTEEYIRKFDERLGLPELPKEN